MRRLFFVVLFTVSFIAAQTTPANVSKTEPSPAVLLSYEYVAIPNITYVRSSNYEAKLDLYRPAGTKTPVPVVLVIHGGGWVNGTKEDIVTALFPYMEMGFAVVNVEYRLAKISPAPAAVEDCLCALHWVGRHAKENNLDITKVIVTGASAGGHLALTTAMIPTTAGFENECANDDDPSGGAGPWPNERPEVAAVINWFGITDVLDLIQGPNTRAYAVTWLGSRSDRDELARKMSPLTYVRNDLPPILTIHGDADTYVPYEQAKRLRDALTKAGVTNKLLTIPGKGHGNFTLKETSDIWAQIRVFLASAGINPMSEASQ